MFNEISGGITAAEGFLAAGVNCGIKKNKKDLAVVYSEVPAIAAGTFTRSVAAAPPVIVSRHILQTTPHLRGAVINSGNANSCTGQRGMNDAWEMVRTASQELGLSGEQCVVASTGVIGEYLPMDRVKIGIFNAVKTLSREHHHAAAEAIMTTDTFSKECAVRFRINDTEVTIGGMAKGSGMIAPNMATMLGFVATDARISRSLLQQTLSWAVDRSFNCISVDGETSTNDMVIMFANGAAGNKTIEHEHSREFEIFSTALHHVLLKLAKMIVADGEGATKIIEIVVNGARDDASARTACRAIANSNLVKTAIHGEDANWGRIMVALGHSGIQFQPENVEIYIGSVPVMTKNFAIGQNGTELKSILASSEVTITVHLNEGNGSSSFWTCDLSHEYVSINAQYRT